MKKFPNSIAVLFAVFIIAGGLLSGCADTSNVNPTPVPPASSDVNDIQPSISSESTNLSDVSNDTVPSHSSESTNPAILPPVSEPSAQTPPAEAPAPASPAVNPSINPSVPNPAPSSQTYKDNTYSESSSYQSPAGTENVTFKFTLAKDIVTNVELTSTSPTPMSQNFQGLFITGIKKEIIGKKLSDLGTFSRVNGSSLTSTGFNNALAKLKTEAKV